jgi:hypothetical protein
MQVAEERGYGSVAKVLGGMMMDGKTTATKLRIGVEMDMAVTTETTKTTMRIGVETAKRSLKLKNLLRTLSS